MSYAVKEIVYTLQGEGANTGRPAVFCRFSGCNLWSGREEDRETAVCRFCDTDFVGTDGPGGGKFGTALDLAEAIARSWQAGCGGEPAGPACCAPVGPRGLQGGPPGRPFVVFTGGEPLLQLDQPLVDALHARGFEVAVETNGTLEPPRGIDWICVSPKAGAPLAIVAGHEVKLVYPQDAAPPEEYERLDFRHFFLQPMDGPMRERNTRLALEYCLRHPHWRISLQVHKLLGIP